MRNAKQILVAARKHVEKYGITGGRYEPGPPRLYTASPGVADANGVIQTICPRGLVCLYSGERDGDKFRTAFPEPDEIGEAAVKALKALDTAVVRVNSPSYRRSLGLAAEWEGHRIQDMKPSNHKRAAVAFIDRALDNLKKGKVLNYYED